MTSAKTKVKIPALAERFNNAVTKLEQEKEVMEKIRDRNLWQIIFSNNTRDLARAGISQSELFSELNATVQDILSLFRESKETQAEIQIALNDAINQQGIVNSDFKQKILALVFKLQEQSVKLQKVEKATAYLDCRVISLEQIEHAETEIQEIALCEGMSPSEKFKHICKIIAQYLAGYSISDIHKKKICLGLKNCKAGDSLLSSDELNSIQPKIADVFAPFHAFHNQRSSAIEKFIFNGIALPRGREYSMSEFMTSVVDAVMISEGDRYNQFREQLLLLIDNFLKENVAEGQEVEDLNALHKRLKESQFEIALIGEFQGGKSTTFNMLCGGREISPRGLNGGGIKTSAAVITAQNIDGEENKNGLTEWAEIDWLTSRQLKERVITVLKDYDDNQANLVYDEQIGRGKVPNPEKSSLDSISKLLKIAWSKNPMGESLDLLRVATLQWKLCTSGKLDEVSQRKIVPIDKFQELVKFPINWEVRWAQKIEADFSLEDLLFVAVDRVLVRIHSDALAYLGCRITDCPGLFVSKWDTERAIDVMRKANAIWYLLSGEKQIGENDERGLQKITDYGWHDKCFFSINRRKGTENTISIMKADVEKLKTQGFNPEHVFIYDAFLAFRLGQFKQLESGWGPRDFECLAIESSKNANSVQTVLEGLQSDPDQCRKNLKRLIQRHLDTIQEDDVYEALSECTEVPTELIAPMEQIAGEQEILNAIEKWIIVNRAYSILISEGSQKCYKILEHFKEELQLQEQAAQITLLEAQKEATEAMNKLDSFLAEWEKRFNFLRTESLDDGLTIDFFQDNDTVIRDEIKKRAIQICKEEWHGSHWFTSDVNKATEERIKEAFSELVQAKLEKYQRNMKKRLRFEESIGQPLAQALKEMGERWKELQDQNDLLKAIEVISADDVENVTFDSFDDKLNGTIDAPMYWCQWVITIFTFGVKKADVRIEEFFNKNDPVGQAYNAFKGDNENEKKISRILGSLRRKYIAQLDGCAADMRKRLEKEIRLKEEVVSKNNTERERIAAIAKDKRQRIIEPYASQIEAYQQEVKRFYVRKEN